MQIPSRKIFQSKIIMPWKTRDGNTADEDEDLLLYCAEYF